MHMTPFRSLPVPQAGSAVDDRMMLTAAGRECCQRSKLWSHHGRTPGMLSVIGWFLRPRRPGVLSTIEWCSRPQAASAVGDQVISRP